MTNSDYALEELTISEADNNLGTEDYTAVPTQDYAAVPTQEEDISPPNRDNKASSKIYHAELPRPTLPPAPEWRVFRSFLPRPMLPSMLMIALYILCVILLLLHFLAITKWPKGDYGMGVLRESMDCGSHGTAFMAFIISFPLNCLSGILGLLSSVFKTKKARPHLIIRVVMILTTIPMHLIYNSVFFRSTSAYDAYEVLVSDDFLHHNSTPFILSTLPLLQTSGKTNPLEQDYDMSTPNLSNITTSILQLQEFLTLNQTQSTWTNLTFSSCQSRYKLGTFKTFSNVILVSNYTSLADTNNSALALTILTGHAGPKHQKHQSLVSLCPQDFFSLHKVTLPHQWKFIPSNPKGLFDPYAPSKFPLQTENIFIKSCYSQEIPQKCRLLYSPLILKIATWCLVVMVGCMTLGMLFSERFEEPEASELGYGLMVFGATLVVFVVYIIQLCILGATEAAKRSPSGPSDQAWLLNAFSIINVVQLIDTICDTICGVLTSSRRLTLLYFPISHLFHWFTSGAFSIDLFDRYIITSNSSLPLPGAVIVPSADLSSLWFENMLNNADVGYVATAAYIFVLLIPFLLRIGAGVAVYLACT